MSLITYLKSLTRTIGKEDIFEDIRITQKEIGEKLIPLFADANMYFKANPFKSEEIQSLNNQFMKTIGKGERYKDMFGYICDKLPLLNANLDALSVMIDKSLSMKLVTQTASIRQAVLIKDLDLISFASIYSFKLLLFTYYHESKARGKGDYDDISMPVPLIKVIISNISIYGAIFKSLAVSPEKFSENLADLKDLPITEENVIALRELKDSDVTGVADLEPVGFDGSPIFHFRLMVAEWQADRYKLNQETKKYLELKLLNLKMKDTGGDAKLEKEIEYTASRINKLEYALAKAERKVGGL